MTGKASPGMLLDELENGAAQKLAGTLDAFMDQTRQPKPPSQTAQKHDVCVKKEKRRRRVFRSFDRL
jgi:hypothetical protein